MVGSSDPLKKPRIQGVDFVDHTYPSVFYDSSTAGSSFYSVRMVELMNNDLWEGLKVIYLGLTTDPPTALGNRSTMALWITDDGDGGEISIPKARRNVWKCLYAKGFLFGEKQRGNYFLVVLKA